MTAVAPSTQATPSIDPVDAAVEVLRSALAACMPEQQTVTAQVNTKIVNSAIASAASGLLMLRYEQARQQAVKEKRR